MAPIVISLFSFNPNLDEHRKLFENSTVQEVHYSVEEPELDLKNLFLLNTLNFNDNLVRIKNELKSYTESNDPDQKISADVFNNSYRFLDNIPPSAIEQLTLDNIYVSNNSTVVFDWEKSSDDLFSLEIGNKSLGYFVELNGVDIKQVESLSLINSEFENTSRKVFEDLRLFL